MSSSTCPVTRTTRRFLALFWRPRPFAAWLAYLLMPAATIALRSRAARVSSAGEKSVWARMRSRSLGLCGSKWIPVRSTITDSGGTRLLPNPTERTNPSSTRTSGTPALCASAIRDGEMREGQTARAAPSACAAASARRELMNIRKGLPGDHRNRRISERFHQLIPQAATRRPPALPRFASMTLRHSASNAIASIGPSQPSENGSDMGCKSACAARCASISLLSPGSPKRPGESTSIVSPITLASAIHSSAPCAINRRARVRTLHGSTVSSACAGPNATNVSSPTLARMWVSSASDCARNTTCAEVPANGSAQNAPPTRASRSAANSAVRCLSLSAGEEDASPCLATALKLGNGGARSNPLSPIMGARPTF